MVLRSFFSPQRPQILRALVRQLGVVSAWTVSGVGTEAVPGVSGIGVSSVSIEASGSSPENASKDSRLRPRSAPQKDRRQMQSAWSTARSTG